MEIKTENTAAENATPTAERLIRYQTLLALLDTLHERGRSVRMSAVRPENSRA